MPEPVSSVAPPHAGAPRGIMAWVGQALLYAAFAAFIGVFSTWPSYSPLGADQALLRLSFSQPGKRVAECRTRSAEEMAKLPPNMRIAEDCPRERSPIAVRIELDGQLLLDETFLPSGLQRDGASSAYRRLPVAAGRHSLRVRIRDDVNAAGYTHERSATVDLGPGQVVLIDFAADRGGVIIR